MDIPPNAEQVARIIVEACKKTGANPIDVASGVVNTDTAISRARAYAALAIRELFPENGSVIIGRLVGAGSPKCYLSSFVYAMRKTGIPWWSDEVYCEVVRTSAARLGLECLVIAKPGAMARLNGGL